VAGVVARGRAGHPPTRRPAMRSAAARD